MSVRRLIDLPAVQAFEASAALNPELRSQAGAVNSEAFAEMCASLFGVTMEEFGPSPPDREGGRDITEAEWEVYDEALAAYVETYGGMTAQSDAALIRLLRDHGWDGRDEAGRPLNCLVPITPFIVAAARGDYGVAQPGKGAVSATLWGVSLAEEAAKFRSKGRGQ